MKIASIISCKMQALLQCHRWSLLPDHCMCGLINPSSLSCISQWIGHGGVRRASNETWGEFLQFRKREHIEGQTAETGLLNKDFIHPFNTNDANCPGLRDLPQVFVVTSCRGGECNNTAMALSTKITQGDKVLRPAIIDRFVQVGLETFTRKSIC